MQVINGVKYLTAGDIGETFGVTRKKVLGWTWDGSLPHPDIKTAGFWLWKADQFIQAGLWYGG